MYSTGSSAKQLTSICTSYEVNKLIHSSFEHCILSRHKGASMYDNELGRILYRRVLFRILVTQLILKRLSVQNTAHFDNFTSIFFMKIDTLYCSTILFKSGSVRLRYDTAKFPNIPHSPKYKYRCNTTIIHIHTVKEI